MNFPQGQWSDEERVVDGEAMLLAVAQIVVDVPEDVERLREIVVVIVEFERAIQPEDGLHPVRVVGYQRVDYSGTFVDVTAWPCHPVVFQIAPATLEHVAGYRAAMLVAAEHAAALDPQNIGE